MRRSEWDDLDEWIKEEPTEQYREYGEDPYALEEDYEDYRRYEDTSRSRRRGGASPLLIFVIVLLVGGMLFAGWKLGSIFLNYRRDRSAYDALAASAISGLADPEKERPAAADLPEGSDPTPPPSQVPISVDWELLRAQNSDVIGWLYCPNTNINYPVVQIEDQDFYLNHGFDKQPNTSGTLFADHNSVAGIVQSNFIIYGHNMKDHSMFGTMTNYTNESYYRDNPIMYYLTPNGNYRIELLCAHIVESTMDNFPTYFANTGEYDSYLARITSSSFWVNRNAVNTSYQLVTLSTCSYTSGYVDPRFLVHGIMIPIQ